MNAPVPNGFQISGASRGVLRRTGRGDQEDERGLRLEAAYVRAAQYTVPRLFVVQLSPCAIAREAPVCNNGERAGEHAPVERKHGAKVRGEAVL